MGVVSRGMQRLCERPGCSESASVAYGMRAEDLVFWLDVLREADPEPELDPAGRGVLCRRHADSMVVPRNWTLDDLREPDLHLFRPPDADPTVQRSSRRRSATVGSTGEQLALGVEPEQLDDDRRDSEAADRDVVAGSPEPADETPAVVPVEVGADRSAETGTGADATTSTAVAAQRDPDSDDAWTPSFDADDDLGGLLAARSPLLARAFRGTDRSRER